MSRILVLGGTSFFGRLFAREAVARGHAVTVFSRRCPSAGLPGGAEQRAGERGTERDLAPLARRDWDFAVDNICFGPAEARLAARLFAGRVGRWVFTSTASVYHAFRAEPPADFPERWAGSAASRGAKPLRAYPYGVGKWRAESEFRAAFTRSAFPAVTLRFPMVVGPGDPKQRLQGTLHRLADGGPVLLPGDASLAWRFLYAPDAVRAFFRAAESPGAAGEAFNVADLGAVTIPKLLTQAARALGAAPRLVQIPIPWLDARGFDYAATPFASERGFAISVAKARKRLGWRSTPVSVWVAETAAAFRRERPAPPPDYAGRARELELAAAWEAERRACPRCP